MPNLLYLHGFNSSSRSAKAEVLRDYLNDQRPDWQLIAPQLSSTPAACWAQLTRLVAEQKIRACVGSSLGGFFATLLSEKVAIPSVLVNPAVTPAMLLSQALGEHTNPYTGETYILNQTHIEELVQLQPSSISVERYLVLMTSGDEVLDYRQAENFYRGARQCVVPGGDHLFTMFEQYLPEMFSFYDLYHADEQTDTG
ncbi:YqiA/YcfP family alpha/beta fold hydrolase [Corallincola platygyrae]|uniref:YqiA/YcfP family alpha/beta fold hydrolase n=1 Tax=Corallincola platygyrae TaxID=1193278 RepID=A0ABW4XN10_9GAMM